ncbi:MAG: glycosyltransferase family 4 protein, partial [Thermodesulfobacteriota bacterium]
ELAKRHEVTVLTSQGLGLPRDSVEQGVRVVRAPVFFRRQAAVANLLSMLAFIPAGIAVGKRLVRENRYDIINTFFVLPSGPVGDALAQFGRIPHILSVLGGDLYDPSKRLSPHRHLFLRAWIRCLLRRSDIVIGGSVNTLGNMRHFYTPEIEGVRIPLGIRRPEHDPAARGRYGFAEDEVLLVTVGRLVARKATSQLIAVMEALRQEKVRLLIIGSGPEETLLKEECAKKRLAGRVCFMGHVEEAEKFRLLRMCDVYVSTSQHEGFGLVFVEAMACGLPIVCYDHGGQGDFLEHAATGYLLPLNDLERFIDHCRLLIKDGELRRMIGRENLRRVNELFIDRCVERYEEIFLEAIARRQVETLVSLSTTKKLPLKLAEGALLSPYNGERNGLMAAPLRPLSH